MNSDECPGHEYIADKNMHGRPNFRARRFASKPVVRAHCTHCKYSRYLTPNEWADVAKAVEE